MCGVGGLQGTVGRVASSCLVARKSSVALHTPRIMGCSFLHSAPFLPLLCIALRVRRASCRLLPVLTCCWHPPLHPFPKLFASAARLLLYILHDSCLLRLLLLMLPPSDHHLATQQPRLLQSDSSVSSHDDIAILFKTKSHPYPFPMPRPSSSCATTKSPLLPI
jgi:hypothetical protein